MNASGAGRNGWAPMISANLYGGDIGVCVCVCVCACAHVRDVFAIYNKKYLTQADNGNN